ncbi:hypothetical protein Dda_0014 [Drechslerella dactyloides]|uniref:Uncharacterized protein n=1 Tax=Drechslerella dactyloides TaxID=74499 RepID=A0AAD6J7H8_DREDA|nr:hypothetical protein Dda_0014 [Drechslerella dactyloides]
MDDMDLSEITSRDSALGGAFRETAVSPTIRESEINQPHASETSTKVGRSETIRALKTQLRSLEDEVDACDKRIANLEAELREREMKSLESQSDYAALQQDYFTIKREYLKKEEELLERLEDIKLYNEALEKTLEFVESEKDNNLGPADKTMPKLRSKTTRYEARRRKTLSASALKKKTEVIQEAERQRDQELRSLETQILAQLRAAQGPSVKD